MGLPSSSEGAAQVARAGLVTDAFDADAATAREGIPALARERLVAFRPEGDWLVAVASHDQLGPIYRFDRLPAEASMASLTWSARGRDGPRLHPAVA